MHFIRNPVKHAEHLFISELYTGNLETRATGIAFGYANVPSMGIQNFSGRKIRVKQLLLQR